jgi:hypothetical protein
MGEAATAPAQAERAAIAENFILGVLYMSIFADGIRGPVDWMTLES